MPLNWSKDDNNDNENQDFEFQGLVDFNTIDSNEKAMSLFQQDKLAKIYLMPLEFGGVDGPQNTLYTPAFAALFKSRFDAMIEDLLREGKELSYTASPKYKGTSFIPSSLTISVTGEAEFTETIDIW